MEGLIHHTNICSEIINNDILGKVYMALPPQLPKIAQFTMKESKKLSDNIMISSVLHYDSHPKAFKQDQPIQLIKSHKTHLLQPLKQSLYQRQSPYSLHCKQRNSQFYLHKDSHSNIISNDLKLIPLETQQAYDEFDMIEQEEIYQKMRERKLHQHFYRVKFLQNLKQGSTEQRIKKSHNSNNKSDSRKNDMIIYDFNGDVITQANQKSQAYKHHQHHFLDLEINVINNNDQVVKQVKKKRVIKPKTSFNNYTQSLTKNGFECLKRLQSNFLRDIQNMRLQDGVQSLQSKQQGRKILGCKDNQKCFRKGINLLKSNQQPVQLRFQDLQTLKTKIYAGERCNDSEKNIKKKQDKKFTLMPQKNHLLKSKKMKQIKVTHSKALQMLINDNIPEQYQKTQFQQPNKTTKKTKFML